MNQCEVLPLILIAWAVVLPALVLFVWRGI